MLDKTGNNKAVTNIEITNIGIQINVEHPTGPKNLQNNIRNKIVKQQQGV